MTRIALGLRSKIMLMVILPIALLLVLGTVAGFGMRTFLQRIDLVDLAHNEIITSLTVGKTAQDMQTGMRGYLLTGQEDFLQPYVEGEKTINQQIDSLKKSAIGGGDQRALLEQAQQILRDWKNNVAEPAIALRRKIGDAKDMNDMALLVAKGRGKEYFDKFRRQIEAFIGREQAVLEDARVQGMQETDLAGFRKTFEEVDNSHRVIAVALKIFAAGLDVETGVRGYLLTGGDDLLASYKASVVKLLSLIGEEQELVRKNPAQIKLLNDMKKHVSKWQKQVIEPQLALRKQISESKTMADMKAFVSRGEDKEYFDRFRSKLEAFQQNENAILADWKKSAGSATSNIVKVIVVGIAIILIAALASYFQARAIGRPLVQAVSLAEAIRDGDLTRSLPVGGNDEIGRLGSALNDMVDSLRDQSRLSLEAVNVLSSTASQIVGASSELVHGTSQTSSAVAETTATVEQVKQSAGTSSGKARSVDDISRQVTEISESAKKATEHTIEKMANIKDQMGAIRDNVVKLNEHSDRIEEIMTVVQDLADQSNLLSVNASIEAARAGELGKGFGVVAVEIKSLAEQSKDAAQQVHSILDATKRWVGSVAMATEMGSKAVEEGVQQSLVTRDSFEKVVEKVMESSQAASVILAASNQQLMGIEQVSMAMVNVEDSIRSVLVRSSQLEGAAGSLSDLSKTLRGLSEHYKL